jgi:hypothetical protein
MRLRPGFCGAILAASFSRAQTPIALPGGSAGIGFDDLRLAPASGKVLVPAGRTGALVLVDPATRGVTPITGFSAKPEFSGGHDDGVTSADEGQGWIFATDRTSGMLAVVDPRSRKIVSSVKLGGPPDYVRFVPTTGELWVTQPGGEKIEIFRLSSGSPPVAAHEAFLSVPGGPESLVVDGKRGRSYTHVWKGKTIAIDVKARAVTATWDNGCIGSAASRSTNRAGFSSRAAPRGRPSCSTREAARLSRASLPGTAWTSSTSTRRSLPPVSAGRKSATMAMLGVSRGQALDAGHRTDGRRGSLRRERERHRFRCDPKKGRLIAV